MSVAYEAFGTVVSAGGTTLAPGTITFSGTAIPSGSGDGFLCFVFWANETDGPLLYDDDVWDLLGDIEGGAGDWGVDDQGGRHISVFWTTQAIGGTSQVFQNGGNNDVGNLTHGYIVRCTKTRDYWARPELAVGADNVVGGATFQATMNRVPPVANGDLVVFATIANTDAVNPAGLTLNWTGVTLGTNTAITTSPFTTGRDSRINLRYRAVTADPAGPGTPTITSSTEFTGAGAMVVLHDSDTLPVVMNAGLDQDDIEPGATVELDSSSSSGVTAGLTWSQQSGPAVVLSSTSVSKPTFIAPYTLTGTTLVFRVTNNATGDYDEVSVAVQYATTRIKTASGWKPVQTRLVQ